MVMLAPPSNGASLNQDFTLTLDAFVRSVGVNRATPHVFFLGAGASITSGVPSAQMAVWEWKRRIFLTNHPGLEEQFSELSLEAVRVKIQRWVDKQDTYPAAGSTDEYGVFIEACYPIASDRRAFFQEQIRAARPHIGYLLLCRLAEAGLVSSVWTTNFDGLAARAGAGFNLTTIEIGIDSQHRLPRPRSTGELMCVSLHGDYRYDALKNTPSELQSQEETLHRALVDAVVGAPLIVAGYSGRDESVMRSLRDAYSKPGNGVLYWCGYEPNPNEAIHALIDLGRANGRETYYVPTEGFDNLLERLALHCTSGVHHEGAKKDIQSLGTTALQDRAPFVVPPLPMHAVIKSNAFHLECPSELLDFELTHWPDKPWDFVRERIGSRAIAAAPLRRRIVALGTVDEIKDAFGDAIAGGVARTPIGESELFREDGSVVSILKSALVQAMAKQRGLSTDGRALLWHTASPTMERLGEATWTVHDAVLVLLRRAGHQQYAVLKPTLRVEGVGASEAPQEIAKLIKQKRLSGQYNKQFNQAVSGWRQRLLPNGSPVVTYEFPTDCGSSFRFRVRRSPAFGEIGAPGRRKPISIAERVKPLLTHKGFELGEPLLLFSNRGASNTVKDAHPIRGMSQNRPYDFSLTQRGLAPSVRLGVVSPPQDARAVRSYLQSARDRHEPAKTERDYLLDYPGFEAAYGLPFEIPEPGSAGWCTYNEPSSADPKEASRQVAQHITQAIANLQSGFGPGVVLVFFPTRLNHCRGYSDDTEQFDVHNFVKAFCVQRGISTQFLEQTTLSDPQRCRVWWWLSLALYVKTMRTPWLLDALDKDSAFVGLGFSFDRAADGQKRVVLGCSHLYSARGEGLQYRLGRIDNPIFRNKNPHMSTEDARRVGETIRQLFFEAQQQLPARVVIHKRTPFLADERAGLLEGLAGVKQVDMLELTIDPALRYVASVARPNGTFDEDNFPVRRGTVLKLDDYSALLWVHGSADALTAGWRYFQGKRRIPTPLAIKRHVGNSDLRLLAEEILGLSKMDWNSFDLYSRFPATLSSSNTIARIGALLSRFEPTTYDYRLFI